MHFYAKQQMHSPFTHTIYTRDSETKGATESSNTTGSSLLVTQHIMPAVCN